MEEAVQSFEQWVTNRIADNTIFIWRRRRKTYTPYEEDRMYMDESEWGPSEEACIVSAMNLGYDWLIGFQSVFENCEREDGNTRYFMDRSKIVNYVLLSEIDLNSQGVRLEDVYEC